MHNYTAMWLWSGVVTMRFKNAPEDEVSMSTQCKAPKEPAGPMDLSPGDMLR